jgi:hypothetical protein
MTVELRHNGTRHSPWAVAARRNAANQPNMHNKAPQAMHYAMMLHADVLI